ncbi:metallophosphoesterase, partial [Patulibacter sp. S7RM1-6]
MTPTAAPERSQTFGWRTDGATADGRAEAQRLDGDVPVGPVLAADATTADARTVGHEGGSDYAVRHHRAKVVGLEPGARYRYRVGSDAGWSPWRTFVTADPDPDRPWRWLYVGDAQNGLDEEWPVNIGRARAALPDAQLVVHAGDQVNRPTYDKDWGDWFAGMGETAATVNQLAVPGNHEYNYDTDSFDLSGTNYLAHFPFEPNGAALGTGSTVVDYRGVRFITLDTGLTGLDALALASQRAWLAQQLESNRQRWTVVTFHFPVYTAADRFPSDNPAVRGAFGDLLEEHDVDLVLNGHDHTYARGFRTRHGPTYVVSVLGPKYYDQQPDGSNTWTANGATRVVAAAETSTFQAVCMLGDRLVYEAVIAAKGDGSTTTRAVGEPLDAVTIDKRDGRKRVLEGGRCATGDPAPGAPAGPGTA